MSRKQIHEVTLDATPEEIWKLITEAEGITRWFAPEARVEPGEGGKIFLSWGEGMEGECPIHLWEPGRGFGWTEKGTGVPKVVEFHLESEGGKTKLRLVQSGFGEGAEFDDEYDAVNGGWRSFLSTLQFGVRYHAQDRCESVSHMRIVPASQETIIGRLNQVFGFQPPLDSVREGDRFTGQLGALGSIQGQRLAPDKRGYYILTLEDWNRSTVGLFAERFGASIALTQQWRLFGEAGARAEALREALPAWQEEIGKGESQ